MGKASEPLIRGSNKPAKCQQIFLLIMMVVLYCCFPSDLFVYAIKIGEMFLFFGDIRDLRPQ